MIVESRFKPAAWLKNPHAQTLWAALARRQPQLPLRRERIELPDGDFVDIDWRIEDDRNRHGPIVVILHGLTGSIESKYARGLMNALADHGCRSLVMNFRGQSGEPNRLPRAYHSGDTGDVNYLMSLLREREPHTQLAIVGYSLGGNVTLKWLGEQGHAAPVVTGVAVSTPFDLSICAKAIRQGWSRNYQNKLLREMHSTLRHKLDGQADANFEIPDLAELTDFFSYDDAITAPLHGFRDVEHYYTEASSIGYLRDIRVPTLALHALDDPFMSPEVVPREDQLSDTVTIELSEHGGHVGFIAANRIASPVYWLEQRIPEHLAQAFSQA
ncbi:MAG: hydrolase [Salinisphaeraceae bacterium]|nr:hydrolase [Salinisphaeraceae bacterium]